MDEATRKDLQQKGLCFHCKQSWSRTHRCLGRGRHYAGEFYVPKDDEPANENEDTESTYEDAEFTAFELAQPSLQPLQEVDESDFEDGKQLIALATLTSPAKQ